LQIFEKSSCFGPHLQMQVSLLLTYVQDCGCHRPRTGTPAAKQPPGAVVPGTHGKSIVSRSLDQITDYGAEISGGLLALQPETREQVRRLVHKLCHDPNLHEDILQEALLCHWRTEVRDPGHAASWYRQRCRFCIQDYLKKGHSVDSLKHRCSICTSDGSGALDSVADDDTLLAICAEDAFNELARRLDAVEQRILRLLRDELTLREIGRELHISHVAVIARRRHIAATAVGLGICL
jgi:RNA polymerase sigma factor (sigma-70 family)